MFVCIAFGLSSSDANAHGCRRELCRATSSWSVQQPRSSGSLGAQGQQLLNVEEAALWVYRDVLPIPIWFRFLMRWPSGIYLPGIVRGCYLTIKFTGLLDKVHVVRSAVEALVLQQTPFGRHASADEVRLVADNMCTICHDSPSTPIRLQVMDECDRV